jgi:hypothetical protein
LYCMKRIRTKELAKTWKQSQSCKIKELWVAKVFTVKKKRENICCVLCP